MTVLTVEKTYFQYLNRKKDKIRRAPDMVDNSHHI